MVYSYLINAIAIPVTNDRDSVRAIEEQLHIPIRIPFTVAII